MLSKRETKKIKKISRCGLFRQGGRKRKAYRLISFWDVRF